MFQNTLSHSDESTKTLSLLMYCRFFSKHTKGLSRKEGLRDKPLDSLKIWILDAERMLRTS